MIRTTESTGIFTITATTIALLLLLLCRATIGQENTRDQNRLRQIKAMHVLSYMNLTVDPCNDFYDFACGNWTKPNNVEIGEGEVFSVYNTLKRSVNYKIDDILHRKIEPSDTRSELIVKDFYIHCLNEKTSSEQQLKFIRVFTRRHGGMPAIGNWVDTGSNYYWVQEVAKIRRDYGLEILIGMDIDVNLHETRGNSIYLREPKTTLIPAHLCSEKGTSDRNNEDYKVVENEVSRNMQKWLQLEETQADAAAGEIVNFEYELCTKMRSMDAEEEEEEIDGRRSEYTRNSEQAYFNKNRKREKYLRKSLNQFTLLFNSTINFKAFADEVFQNSINDMVYMSSKTYFDQLAHSSTNSKPRLANYIMYRALSELNFPLDVTKRRDHCANFVLRYFPKHIGELYERSMHRSEIASDVGTVFENIKRVTNYLNVQQKLSQLVVKFPIYQNINLNNVQTTGQTYWHQLEKAMELKAKQELEPLSNYKVAAAERDAIEAPDVGIKAMPKDSKVYVGWGFMQEPYYDYYYAQSLKYSLLGQRLAREIIYALDDMHSVSDNSNRNSYGNGITDSREETSECFRAQFSNYLYNNPDDFRNGSKLRELIADSSGLNIAFDAYLLWLDSMDSVQNRRALLKETLPEVSFTNTQLFFINFAQMRCFKKCEKEPPREYLPLDWHTYERYDVNGPLSNNAEFAREFGCAAGTQMNPDDKCVLHQL